MHSKRDLMLSHIREFSTIYLFMTMLFLTGIIFGAIMVNSMSFIQKQDLFFFLERYFGQIKTDQTLSHLDILKSSFLYHTRYLLFLFILGLSILGLPIVWIILFLKGLVVGFSVGFIVNQLGFNGLILAALSIAPQNIFIIPIYIIAGSLSMIFSLTLLGKLFSRRPSQPIFQPFGRYMMVFTILWACSFLAAFIEAFVANEVMQAFIKRLI